MSKLYDMGVLNTTAKLSEIENKLTVAAFCRRRLGVVMRRLNMAESVSAVSAKDFLVDPAKAADYVLVESHCLEKLRAAVLSSIIPHSQAVKFIEHGHVRVGPDTITDPAFLVTR